MAKSNFVGLRFREPIFRNLRELVMSYFEQYYNVANEKTLRAYTLPLNLKTFDKFDWMISDDHLDRIATRLDQLRKIPVITLEMAAGLSLVDKRSSESGLFGSIATGLFKPGQSKENYSKGTRMNAHHFLGFDIGASSGRTLLGTLQNEEIIIKELHRFPNGMIDILGNLRWNILELFENIKKGMKVCTSGITTKPESIAVDTWGVDYGLFAADGNMLGLPYGYRDARTDEMMDEFFKIIPRDRIYELTGIQFMQLNTLFQLFSMKRANSPLLDIVSDLLFMPDMISYFLTGIKKTEFTIATTSQLYNPMTKDWDDELFRALGISKSIMQEIAPPGTILGNLSESIANETGLDQIPVVATASHDTGAAVAAVPAQGKDWAYISSGTWSLVGVEITEPIINKKSLEFNFTNEGGVGGTFRFLKNCMGLWPVQQCRKAWSSEKELSYTEMTKLAASARPFVAVIDPDYQGFLNPPDMPAAIREYCRKTRQTIPADPAEMTRSILESLVLKYRNILDQLKLVHLHPIHRIHIIGGGTQNKLLSQFTANATGIPVVAGPVEATAIGNIMVQAMGMGIVKSPAEIRKIIANSFELEKYEPQDTKKWDAAYERFVNIIR